jgi:hypothetical protein
MDCHDAQLLLSFADRRCEEFDAAEREALQQHLDKCPDCSRLARADRQLDESLARVMRDVPVPLDMKQKIMTRLAAERSPVPWQGIKRGAIGLLVAAGMLAIIGGFVWWKSNNLPQITASDIEEMVNLNSETSEARVEQYFNQKRGLNVHVPRRFNYEFLQHVEVVEFKGRRVAKLTFSRTAPMAIAEVLILSPQQFRLDGLQPNQIINAGNSTVRVESENDFVYLIFSRGDYGALRHEPPI